MCLHFEHGEVVGDISTYTISDFPTLVSVYSGLCPDTSVGGHGGGDAGLIWARRECDAHPLTNLGRTTTTWRRKAGRGSMAHLSTQAVCETNGK